jgi:hypothetical protein
LGTKPQLVERLVPAGVRMTLPLGDRIELPTTVDNQAIGFMAALPAASASALRTQAAPPRHQRVGLPAISGVSGRRICDVVCGLSVTIPMSVSP